MTVETSLLSLCIKNVDIRTIINYVMSPENSLIKYTIII